MNLDSDAATKTMIGNSLTHYRITAKLGEGGMGEVYRASDTKLGREVAIKVLPVRISRDATSLARFEREAKALAALNHPHIAGIYGFDAERETHFLVLELVEGQTLSERLRRGRLPLDEALRVARQIAEAVEAAHAKGIIHRDLKPGNIKLTPEGRVKVLDFGLAKMEESVRSSGTPASDPDAPTLKAETTQAGAVMGTPAYMSPEQARGQEVDKRTDVWAFGCCLFECLAGSKPFRGDTVTDLMAEVLRSEPEWAALPAEVPREVVALLRRCLEKDPRRRLRDLGDIALVLEDSTPSRPQQPTPPAQTESQPPTPQPAKPSFWNRFGPAFAALSVLALLGLAILSVALWRTPKTANRASQIRSLAVLPFAFETQDPKLSGLGKWIPAEIRSKLGPLQNLQVVNSPARIEQLVQQKKSEVDIARELGVDGLVMGELHGQGETMSAYVWVVDGATGRALGRQREMASAASRVSEIPNQVALAIVDELKLQISTSERTEIGSGETQNAEAFLAFQRGQELLSSRQFSQAASELRRAYQLDTNYTRAWALGAESEWVPFIYGGTTNEIAATFKRLSVEAERLHAQRPADQVLATPRMLITMIFERDWNKVSAVFWESQRNAKPDASVLSAMSWYYAMIEGHPGPALHAIEQAIGMAPENFLFPINRGHLLSYFGRYDDAASAFRKLPPEKIPLEDYSRVLLMTGDVTGAKEVATRVLAGRPNAWTQCHLAAIHARSGAPDEARKILGELETQAEKGMHIPYAQIAWSYGMLGEFESARRWLRKGLLEGHGDWSMVGLRTAEKLEIFGKLAWYWEIVDGMKFPPLQMGNPYFELEQAMRYHRGVGGELVSTAGTNEPPRTLAVLPLEPLGNWVDTDGLTDGLTIALNDSLQKVRGLKVPGWISSMTFKGASNLLSAGRGLQVDHLLVGRVARAGDQLRFSLSLDRTDGGPPLWSTNYVRKQSDIFALQSEIAHQVAGALKLTLGVQERQDLDRKVTESPEAFDLYLKGRAAWNRRTIPEFERATNFFGQALAKDANFALAYAGLADVHTLWPVYTGEPPGAHSSETITFARLALEKDPRLAEPHAALGFSLFAHHCDWEGAEREFQAAIRLNPESATAHKWYAELLYILGRPDEALQEAQRSVELDPSSQNKDTFATAMARAGQVERAVAYFDQLIAAEPSFLNHRVWFVLLLAEQGDLERASKVFAQAERDFGQRNTLWKPWLLALEGKAQEARELLAQEQKPSGSNVMRALVLHALGEDREALDLLEKAVQQRELLTDLTFRLPLWSKLHGDPRFRAILKSIHLENHIPVPASTNAK